MNCLYIDTCKSGDLRLTDDLTYYKGRVEMYQNSEWRTICNDGWDVNDAIVVCRQLNYLSTSIQVKGRDVRTRHTNSVCTIGHILHATYELMYCMIALSYGEHHFKSKRSSMLLADVGCNSSESNLTSCCATVIHSRSHCHSGLYAGVRCMHNC